MKAVLEHAVATGIHALGLHGPLLGLAARAASGNGHGGRGPAYQILNYHRVDTNRDPFLLRPVDPAHFEGQVKYLKRNYRVLPLRELMRRAQDGTLEPRSVALTFDDGYRDNYRFAFPVLRKHGVPATLFLATGCTEGGEPLWYDRVFYVFKATRKESLDIADWGLGVLPLGTVPQRQQAMSALADHFRAIPDTLRLERQAELDRRLGVSDFKALDGLMLSWDEVRELDANGFEVEGHTVTHPILSRVAPEALKDQLEGCKRTLEEKLQKEVALFAYPNGRPEDFDDAAKAALKAAGFRYAFTTVFGLNRRGDDPYAQRRAAPWHEDAPRFAFDQLKIQAGR